MVRQLSPKDEYELYQYINQDPIINCYLISDLSTFGLDGLDFSVYGQFNKDTLEAVFAKFDEYGVFYTQLQTVEQGFRNVIEQKKPTSISGDSDSIKALNHVLKNERYADYQLAVLTNKDDDFVFNKTYDVHSLKTKDEIEMLYRMLQSIKEFNVKDKSLSAFINEKALLHKSGATYGIYHEKAVIASASVIAQTDNYGVINGVATAHSFRNQGFARYIVSYLIDRYLNHKNMGLILYYDNPAVVKLYKDLGFQDYGTWRTLQL